MPDREKVLKALEHHKESWVCNGCPYASDDDTPQGNCPVYDDAIALLRGQTRWVEETDRRNHYHCESCGYPAGIVARTYKHCPGCGRMVKWNG